MNGYSPAPPTSTFVVRFWREWSAGIGRWRGRIEHIQSGQHAYFMEMEDIIYFLRYLGVTAEDQAEIKGNGLSS